MKESIETWLRQLDAICEAQKFETADEAEAWLKSVSDGLSIEEFFDQYSPAESHLRALLAAAEQCETPDEALNYYERAVRVGERFYSEAIVGSATSTDVAWEEAPLRQYVMALGGQATCLIWTMRHEDAALCYEKMLRIDPLDHAAAFEGLFCLLVTMGKLDDAEKLLESRPAGVDAFSRYSHALMAILKAADLAALQEMQGIEVEAESEEEKAANMAVDLALRTNRYMPHILTHPRSMQIEWHVQPTPGSPSEALAIAHVCAHLWLGDPLALEWLMQMTPRYPLSHGGHDDEWQNMLDAMGGDATHEERIAYLRALEEGMG